MDTFKLTIYTEPKVVEIRKAKADNFYPVTTNSCHNGAGQYADYDKLPEHLRVGDKAE